VRIPLIVMSQAQLQKTEAEIANATARYDYQIRRADLDFQVGTLR
jgi:outer membrane protein TolC